jgi:hypothetical protein
VSTQEATAEVAARAIIERIISWTGAPGWIVSDQGKAFTGDIIKELCRIFGMKKIQTTAYHPQSNGATERVHRDLNRYLKQFVNKRQDDWDLFLPTFEIVRRASDIRGTGVSQSALRFGRELEVPTELTVNGGRNEREDEFRYIGRLRAAIRQSAAILDGATNEQRKRDARTWDIAMKQYQTKALQEGELVMLYTPTCDVGLRPKLTTMWRGPYVITKQTSPVNYVIRHTLLAGKPEQCVHAARLKR